MKIAAQKYPSQAVLEKVLLKSGNSHSQRIKQKQQMDCGATSPSPADLDCLKNNEKDKHMESPGYGPKVS